ncbi:MAG: phospholipase/carboxylesterase [Lysobacterales bacterium]|jgi:phospholipase/carboxylesterase
MGSLNGDWTATLYAMNEPISAADKPAKSSQESLPETVELVTGPDPVNAVIWLHGLGADGHDFEPLVPMLGLEQIAATRFIFPHAPVRPVTINGGMSMRAWYDIKSIGADRDQDQEGIEQSAEMVTALIARENSRGIPSSNIVIAGFSQGGAIAAFVALRYPQKLAGLMILSSYLLFPEQLGSAFHPSNSSTPVFIGHGSMDPVVPVVMGRDIANRLRALNMPVEWHEYAMPHSVIQEEIVDIGNWLRARLK